MPGEQVEDEPAPPDVTIYKDPLMIVEGFMQYLYDETGRRYVARAALQIAPGETMDSALELYAATVALLRQH